MDAVKNGKIFYFPCELTCRASTHAGYFASWLFARIYENEFSRKKVQIFKDHIFKSRHIDLDLDYIEDARIVYSRIHDFVNKTLVIEFKAPLSFFRLRWKQVPISTHSAEGKGCKEVGFDIQQLDPIILAGGVLANMSTWETPCRGTIFLLPLGLV